MMAKRSGELTGLGEGSFYFGWDGHRLLLCRLAHQVEPPHCIGRQYRWCQLTQYLDLRPGALGDRPSSRRDSRAFPVI
jgi:hypothetical protein